MKYCTRKLTFQIAPMILPPTEPLRYHPQLWDFCSLFAKIKRPVSPASGCRPQMFTASPMGANRMVWMAPFRGVVMRH